MQIQINEINEVIGFASVGGFEDGIIPATVPTGFEENFRPGKYIYTGSFVIDNPNYVEPKDNRELLEQIAKLKNELTASDYKAIKYAEGWISEEEYYPIKAHRQEIRDKINILELDL